MLGFLLSLSSFDLNVHRLGTPLYMGGALKFFILSLLVTPWAILLLHPISVLKSTTFMLLQVRRLFLLVFFEAKWALGFVEA